MHDASDVFVQELTETVLADTAQGGLLDLMEATSYKGGVRAAYVGVVLPSTVRSGSRNARSIGPVTWRQLQSILSDT